MNVLLHLYPGDAVAVLVANVAVQTTVVTLLALWAARRFAKDHPAARHTLLLSALACVVLSPAFSYLAYRADLALFRIPVVCERPFDVAEVGPRGPAVTPQAASQPPEPEMPSGAMAGSVGVSSRGLLKPTIEPAAALAASAGQASWSLGDRLRAAGGALVAVWLAGVFWLSARLLRGFRVLFQVRRDLRYVGPSEIGPSLEGLRPLVGAWRLPPIAISSRVTSPVTAGVFRATIILPKQMLQKLEPAQLQDVLAHEWAHVIRRDHLVSLLQRVVHILLWPHPWIASLNRELARAREEVCDNYVLSRGDGIHYARTLLEVGQRMPGPDRVAVAVGLLPPRWNLEARIAGFLDANRKLVTRVGVRKAAGVAAGLVLLALAIAGMAQAAPELPAAQPAEQSIPGPRASTPAPRADLETVQVGGRVLDPNGRPFQGAKVYVVTYPWSPEAAPQTVSGAEGQFQLGLSRSELEKILKDKGGGRIRLLATASGYGFSMDDLDAKDPGRPLDLRLVKDLPIRGRLLNPEGKPVAGATIRLADVFSPLAGTLDGYIEAVPDGQQWQSLSRNTGWFGPLPGMPDPIVAGADGRFEITGVGAERVCRMYVAGPGIDEARITVMTRQTEPVKPFVQETLYRTPIVRAPVYPHYGATFEHVGVPARTIRGVVRDKKTGQPVSGVRIVGLTLSGKLIPETDEQGRFEFPGRPKMPHYEIEVLPQRQPYFAERLRIEDTPGLEPIEVTVDLARGLLVTGHVRDQQTGEPVEGTLEYHPVFPDAYEQQLGRSINDPCSTAEVGPDGSYAIAVLPGAGLLAFQASYKLEDRQYMSALVDPAEIQKLVEGVEVRGDQDFLETFAGGQQRSLIGQRRYQSLGVIKPEPESASMTVDLTCQRGRSLAGSVVGPDGKPVRGASVTGLYAKSVYRKTILEGSTFTVRALNPRRTRPLLFYHAEKQLGAALNLAGDQQGPLVVRLEPCGVVVGRVVDRQGQPVAGAAVLVSQDRFVDSSPPWIGKTDGEGRFRIGGIVPGQAYAARLQDQSYLFAFQLDPGETRDLGTKKLRR